MKTKPVSSKRGLEIIKQGAQQYMAMGFEDSRGNPNCPFDPQKQPIETKLWTKGYNESKFKWTKQFAKRERRPIGPRPAVTAKLVAKYTKKS